MRSPIKQQRGFSLLEVMIAGAVTSVGLAGLAALLTATVLETSESLDRTVAAMLAGHMATIVALTPAARSAFLSAPSAAGPACAVADGCTPAEFAAANHRRWLFEVARQLPGGTGVVCLDATPDDGVAGRPACDGGGPLVVKVFWQAPGAAGGESRRTTLLLGT